MRHCVICCQLHIFSFIRSHEEEHNCCCFSVLPPSNQMRRELTLLFFQKKGEKCYYIEDFNTNNQTRRSRNFYNFPQQHWNLLSGSVSLLKLQMRTIFFQIDKVNEWAATVSKFLRDSWARLLHFSKHLVSHFYIQNQFSHFQEEFVNKHKEHGEFFWGLNAGNLKVLSLVCALSASSSATLPRW